MVMRWGLSAVAETGGVDDEAVADVGAEHAILGLVDGRRAISSVSGAMPCSAQKSSISCVSAMPPMVDPANERRLLNRVNTATGSGSGGAPTLTRVPLRRSSRR